MEVLQNGGGGKGMMIMFYLLGLLFVVVPSVTGLDRVHPVQGKSFGAEIHGFDLSSLSQESVKNDLRAALDEHLLLMFRDPIGTVSPKDHLEFARIFGPVERHLSSPPKYLWSGVHMSNRDRHRNESDLVTGMLNAAAQNQDEFMFITKVVKEPSDAISFGEGWHSDLTFFNATPYAVVLVSRELPPKGGNTKFASMYCAYDTLSSSIKKEIEQLFAKHSDKVARWAIHPVVRRNLDTGRRSLWVNSHFTRYILGHESNHTLLATLIKHIEELEVNHPHCYQEVVWTPGTILVWDNRFTQHAAQNNYPGYRRELHRVISTGEVPAPSFPYPSIDELESDPETPIFKSLQVEEFGIHCVADLMNK